jgi:hypothetical protein
MVSILLLLGLLGLGELDRMVLELLKGICGKVIEAVIGEVVEVHAVTVCFVVSWL